MPAMSGCRGALWSLLVLPPGQGSRRFLRRRISCRRTPKENTNNPGKSHVHTWFRNHHIEYSEMFFGPTPPPHGSEGTFRRKTCPSREIQADGMTNPSTNCIPSSPMLLTWTGGAGPPPRIASTSWLNDSQRRADHRRYSPVLAGACGQQKKELDLCSVGNALYTDTRAVKNPNTKSGKLSALRLLDAISRRSTRSLYNA